MKWKNGSTRLFTALALVAVFGCGNEGSDAGIGDRAPDTFTVGFETSAGPFAIEFVRDWSPIAVDRAYRLSSMGYWAGSRIYRVNEAYAQFGYSGRPALDSAWVPDGLPDEPARSSNVRGSVSFARGGPNTRSTILFINRGDNVNLDDMQWNDVVGFPPVGRVTAGMDVVDRLFSGYGDTPMRWEDSIAAVGNAFLEREYPELDSITAIEVRAGASPEGM